MDNAADKDRPRRPRPAVCWNSTASDRPSRNYCHLRRGQSARLYVPRFAPPLRYVGRNEKAWTLANARTRIRASSNVPADVGVTGFEIGVVGFSRSSIFFADGVLALLLVPLRGDGGGTSFFTWPLSGTEEGPSLSRPFSRGEEVPFAAGLVGPSLASSTTKSWSLFSPSLCCRRERARLY